MRIKVIAMSAAVVSAVGRLSALFAAPTIVYPAENAEVKTISNKIWNEIHNESVYFKQATFYQETYTGAYRQSAMKEVSTNSLPIVFRWSGTSGECTVKAWRTRDLSADPSAAPIFAATTTGTSATYWDPEVGRDFTWTVEDSAGRATGHFHTAQRAPRIIYADHNPDPAATGAECTAGRDLGGWLTADGAKKVRQGMVYRSAALEYCSPGGEGLYKPLEYLQDTLGIRLDLDLRTVAHLEKYWIGANGWNCDWKNGAKLTITESNIGPLVKRYCVDSDYAEFPSYTGFTSTVANKKAVWAAFNKIYESVVVKGEPVVFHCSHGKDRTGSLAYVLLGALGVSEPDARRDFGFTWYLEAKNDTCMDTDGSDGYDGLNLLLNALPSGETFKDRCVAYLNACGTAASDSGASAKITAFQSAMLEDAEDPGSGGGSSDEPAHEEPSSGIKPEWGYVKRGLGAFGNEVAVVFTNHTAESMTWTVPADLTDVQFLVVGGGGGGGGDNCASDGCIGGGGGGGGGVVTGLVYSVAKNAVVTVSVGAGGAGGTAGTKPGTSSYNYCGGGIKGSNSSFAIGGITYVTAIGGGRDLGVSTTGSTGTRYQGGQGGSSAGSRAKKTTQGNATQGEIGSGAADLLEAVLFGNKGGAGVSSIEYASAGGGGATESGYSPESTSKGGKGGEGLLSEITGTAEVYGSGGGGGTALSAGVGGTGGTNAGDGHRTGKANGENGVANRGGGGGGGGGEANGGKGGSGIVVFRYVEQILPRVGDDEAGVEIDKVFDVARVSKPIVYPSHPVLREEDGAQQIVFGGCAVDVPPYYTAALAETTGGFEVSLLLNDRARPVISDGEGDEAPANALVIENGVVKIHLENVYSGLYYRLERSTEIGAGANWVEVSEWQQSGDFSSLLGSDPAAFYKVVVTDEPPTGD